MLRNSEFIVFETRPEMVAAHHIVSHDRTSRPEVIRRMSGLILYDTSWDFGAGVRLMEPIASEVLGSLYGFVERKPLVPSNNFHWLQAQAASMLLNCQPAPIHAIPADL